MDITKDRRRRDDMGTRICVVVASLAVVVGAAILMGRGLEEDAKPSVIDGMRTFHLSELAEKCPGVKPMLATALADDRIMESEAVAIESEGRRLYRVSTDAQFHNAARTSAGLKPNPEPADCDLPHGLQPE